jgi:plasmid stabilization system protein ParE
MPLPVKLLARAQADLRAIHRYIAADSPVNADNFIARLHTAILNLGDFPLAGPAPRDDRLRRKGYRFIQQGEYLIFYKASPRQVTVYRVLHGKRQYSNIL